MDRYREDDLVGGVRELKAVLCSQALTNIESIVPMRVAECSHTMSWLRWASQKSIAGTSR